MMLLQALERFEKEFCPGLRRSRVLLAVSGGLDSMVLLHLAQRSNLQAEAAHVNFGLRGAESDRDEQLVAATCEDLRIPLHIYRPATEEFAADNRLSVQMAARELRYHFFEECIKTRELNYVLTAHHSGDNLEHFIIYLLRNNPLTALRGIEPVREPYLRPLLPYSRKELLDWAREQGVVWCEDSSNLSDKYLRNRIRHHIIPCITAGFPEAEAEFAALNRSLAPLLKRLAEKEAAVLQQYRQEEGGRVHIDAGILHHTAGNSALQGYLRRLGFTASQFEDLQGAGKGAVFYAGGHYLAVEERGFVMGRGNPQGEVYRYLVEALHEPLYLYAGQFEISLEWEMPEGEMTEDAAWYFDAAQLEFPLILRNWSQGDRLQPFGMKGHKKLSDLFTDAKTGITEKHLYPVLESGGRILGVTGLRRSALAPVGPDCRRALKMAWRKR